MSEDVFSLNSKFIDRDIEKEMRESFLQYSMSVIVSRALPDVRDGLKPVHRRILYTMHENGLTPDKEYRKCADTVGSVLGRYHPHGDASVYDALVRLAQSFSLRYPLVDGHGNFGSLDGDPPAAYRYTEARMGRMTLDMLTDIGKDTVDFSTNYDDRLKEPVVLPSRFPNLIVNGSVGIAVGMATNIPPHNLTETVNAVQALIKNPDCTLDELMEHIKGPDFPTGGDKISPSSFSDASGCERRACATSSNPSGSFSKPIVSRKYVISSICLTAAETVLLMFAVSQLTFRFTVLRISFSILTFSSSIRDTCASMTFRISTICEPSLRYTT